MLTFARGYYSLVDGFNPSEKYAQVSWDNDYPQYDGKVKKKHGSKPPTSSHITIK